MGVETFLFLKPWARLLVKTVWAVSLAWLPEDMDLAIVTARSVIFIGIDDIAIILFGWPLLERLAGKFHALLSVMTGNEGPRASNTLLPMPYVKGSLDRLRIYLLIYSNCWKQLGIDQTASFKAF
ncbi:hypothetical protein Trisim1_004704 [Trichoderma cf. simile WF8]|uniref:Uncharacterized protein n=1 Tax=Trichoderma guizhouense TaxID=1491466 RepID=A0A1T3CIB3_9HYPO|nr:hypothetical protein A0O28_0009150 [Trichoderma guizhouense]